MTVKLQLEVTGSGVGSLAGQGGGPLDRAGTSL